MQLQRIRPCLHATKSGLRAGGLTCSIRHVDLCLGLCECEPVSGDPTAPEKQRAPRHNRAVRRSCGSWPAMGPRICDRTRWGATRHGRWYRRSLRSAPTRFRFRLLLFMSPIVSMSGHAFEGRTRASRLQSQPEGAAPPAGPRPTARRTHTTGTPSARRAFSHLSFA